MFSSTTIASSITMPTESVSASIVIMLSVKPMYQMRPNVAMIDVGMAMAEMIVERRFVRNSKHDERREQRADDEVFFDVVDRRFDELGAVADDAQLVAGRQRLRGRLELFLDAVDDLDGVGARLPADVQQHRARAVDVRDRVGVGHAVFDLARRPRSSPDAPGWP